MIIVKVREILNFIESLEIQEPKKKLRARKCNQKINNMPSEEYIVYKFSKLEYSVNISSKDSSDMIII